jgi:HAMP domain-containing protein
MLIFRKIFIRLFVFFVFTIIVLSFILGYDYISYAKEKLYDNNRSLGGFIAKQIELGFYQSDWPYESLSKLTMEKDFLFWWVVKEDGSIYRSDDPAFMGTDAYDYFPQVKGKIIDDEIHIDQALNRAIYFKSLKLGTNDWTFWLGFSISSISNILNDILVTVSLLSAVIICVLAVFLFFTVKMFTKPIGEILEGTKKVAEGMLDTTITIRSRDELGRLAESFNDMTKDLRDSKDRIEQYNRTLEEKVDSRTKELQEKNQELDRFNRLAVGRELRMIELKKTVQELKERLSGKSR